MIRFTCQHCAAKLTAREDRAGKVSRCPRCKKELTIPDPPAALPEIVKAKKNEPTLIEPALQSGPPTPQAPRDENACEPQPEESRPKATSADARERRLPWPAVILLYPANTSGIIHLVVLLIFSGLLAPALNPLYWHQPPIMHLALLVIVAGYCLFYLTGCIRDSAGGETKAPDVNQLPERLDTDAIISKLFAIFVWTAFCLGPPLVCAIAGRTDYLLWLLVGYAVFYAPIALLAVVMFDSVRALSPLLIVPSIVSVFLPYLLLVLGLILSFVLMGLLYRRTLLGSIICAYLLMVLAHILGRFYLRYEDRLNWEA